MLAKTEKQRDRLVRRFADADDDSGVPWELLEREVARLESERRSLVAALADIDARLAQQEATTIQLDAVHDYCATVAINLDTADFATKRTAVEALVERVDANGREWGLVGPSQPGPL